MSQQQLTRREFVRTSLAGGMLLALTSGLAAVTGCSGPDPAGRASYFLLRKSDLPVLRALVPVVLSGALAEPLEVHNRQVDRVLGSLDALLWFSAKEIRREARRLLDLLSFPPTRIMLAGVARSWESADEAEVSAFLRRWAESPLKLLQHSSNALTRSIQVAWYALPPSHAATGYPGPPDTARVLLRSAS